MEEEDLLNTRLSRSSLDTFGILKWVAIEQFNDQPPIQFPKLKIEEDVDLKDQLYNDEQNEIKPDQHDPNNYCKACARAYSTKWNYKVHLEKIHGIIVVDYPAQHKPTIMTKEETPDEHDPDNHCKCCRRTYANKWNYTIHLQKTHGIVVSESREKKNYDVLPDEDDKNGYCSVCQKTLSSIWKYREHLQWVHNMTLLITDQRRKANPSMTPDENDRFNHCKFCKHTFPSKQRYRAHLRRLHKMTLVPLIKKGSPDPLVAPDKNDPNGYCRSCDIKYHSIWSYRAHLRRVHHIMLPPLKKTKNPLIQPDINDPNSYCKSCDIHFNKSTNKYGYRKHLMGVHGIILEPLKKPAARHFSDYESDYYKNGKRIIRTSPRRAGGKKCD